MRLVPRRDALKERVRLQRVARGSCLTVHAEEREADVDRRFGAHERLGVPSVAGLGVEGEDRAEHLLRRLALKWVLAAQELEDEHPDGPEVDGLAALAPL